MRRSSLLGLAALLLPLNVCAASGAESAAAADEQALRGAGIPTDGPGLLRYVRGRTVNPADETRIKKLVWQLGDDSFEVRERASAELVTAGARARPWLQKATHDRDPEVVWRSRRCLEHIQQGATAAVLSAAVRALARARPAGAAAALLEYLPSAEDESVAEEVRLALVGLAVRDGKAEPALAAALADRDPARRAAAARALCRADLPDQVAAVRKLLRDPAPAVRLRAALSLIDRRHKEAVPVLIALLDRPPLPGSGRALDLLYRLAGEKAPAAVPLNDAESRARYRAAWEAWWKGHGDRVDLAKLEAPARPLGYTLVVLLDAGEVIDLDASNRPRFEIDGLRFPLDAQILPGERVLVAEHNGNQVTERNRKGEVLWKFEVEGPLAAQRLPNGHTFIALRDRLIEVDHAGKEVFSYRGPRGELFMKAQKLPNGDIACVMQMGTARYARLDRTGRQLKSFGVDVRTSGGRLEVQPDGHVLIPEMGNDRVVEYDADGKVVREASVSQPIAAVCLPGGNWLVTSMNQRRAVELDKKGKVVWDYRAPTRVTRAFRR